jgi:hypothetical protein
MVWKQLGIRAQLADVEDGVQYILQQFYKNDVIAQYDPQTISGYNGRPVTFAAFIKAKIALYCRGLRQNLERLARQQPLMVDAPAQEGSEARWIDLLAGRCDDYPSISDNALLDRLRAGLAKCPAQAGMPLVPLFDAMTTRFAAGQPMTPASMRRELGATDNEQVEDWMAQLRTALHEVATTLHVRAPELAAVKTGRHVPVHEVGGMLLTGAEVRAAVAALKNSRGNRVLPAFTDAGHPLAAAGKTWYLDFAARVMEEYPETRTARGGHFPGGHFGRVKAALIYGLEQMAPAEPESADTDAWAALEAAIVQLPGVTPDTAEAMLEAARLLLASGDMVSA